MGNKGISKNINDLREILSQEIDKLREGKTTPASINAITNATGKIFSSIKLQMEYAKILGEKPNIKFIGAKEDTVEDQ
ncbi:MAG: hypothetical protein IT276_07955 [Ignavibacteriaceae bacterium]|nr:hypothetical protein [Ignavibacteriaceae bacterium]